MDQTTLTQPAHAPVSHTIMFWILSGLAMLVFAPCVLVPVWCETEAIAAHEQQVASVVARLEKQVERNEARIQALLADPVVNQRIMRRELNHHPPDERVVSFPAEDLAGLDVSPPEPPPQPSPTTVDLRPAWLASAQRWLPAWPWRKLFTEPANRSLLLAMSGGLLAAAFLLYGPVPEASTDQRHPG